MAVKLSLFRKLFGGYLLLSGALVAVIFLLFFFSLLDYSRKMLGVEYVHSAKLAAELLSEYPAAAALPESLSSWPWRVTVIAADGVVLADTQTPPLELDNHATRREFWNALRGVSSYDIRHSQTMQKDFLYAAAPIVRQGEISGAVRISLPLQEITADFIPFIGRALGAALAFGTLLALLVLGISRKVAGSLRSLEQATLQAAEGQLQARVYFTEQNDFKPLADNFNKMAGQLETSLRRLASQKTELETILASMQHGLLVVAPDDCIKLSNQSLREIAGQEVDGHYCWEIFPEEEFGVLLKKTRREKQSGYLEIQRQGKYYNVIATALPLDQGLVILMRDITEMRRLEKIKKDFVLNASHELRTPLTAIKGFAETLAAETDGAARHYAEVIQKNTERLIALVQDILVLSELEERGVWLEEKVDLKKLLLDLPPLFAERLREKNLRLDMQAEKSVVIRGDSFKLQQVFINLLDNALKYTEQGGLTVRLSSSAARAVVSVADTGPGIPSADLDRIFERFYVVDKSRSRAVGGTGLGLAIVKHIVLLHNGAVDVRSTPGQGSEFTVTLPL